MNDALNPEEVLQLILAKVSDLEDKIQGISNQLASMEENQTKLEKKVEEAEGSIMASVNSYSDPCRYIG